MHCVLQPDIVRSAVHAREEQPNSPGYRHFPQTRNLDLILTKCYLNKVTLQRLNTFVETL